MKRSWNPTLWSGFVVVLLGILSYPMFFVRFPVTRDFPWVNLLILALGLALLAMGVGRAFRHADQYRGKISGSIVGVLTVLFVGFFLADIFVMAKQLPASHGAPQVGQMAPDFTLPDSQNNPVTLSTLLSSPFTPNGSAAAGMQSGQTAGAVLIFYRGYW